MAKKSVLEVWVWKNVAKYSKAVDFFMLSLLKYLCLDDIDVFFLSSQKLLQKSTSWKVKSRRLSTRKAGETTGTLSEVQSLVAIQGWICNRCHRSGHTKTRCKALFTSRLPCFFFFFIEVFTRHVARVTLAVG